MCLACEQDAIWLAYLESQGLLQPDDAAVEALFADFQVQPLPVQPETGVEPQNRAGSAAEKNPFICDNPKTG